MTSIASTVAILCGVTAALLLGYSWSTGWQRPGAERLAAILVGDGILAALIALIANQT